MKYKVISNKKVCGKVNGESLTEDDIISAGGNVEFLLAAGHISKDGKTPKVVEEPQIEIPQVQVEEIKVEEKSDAIEESDVFVFNQSNYEGDK